MQVHRCREWDHRSDNDGFTLIELMVVVLIIAILIAIAIPTFLGARGRANERAVQSSLRNGLTAAKTSFTDAGSYTNATVAALQGIEPSLTFQAGASTGPKVVRVVTNTATDVILSAQSTNNKCYYVTDNSSFGSAFALETGACSAAASPAALAATPAAGTAATASASGTAPTWASIW